MTVKVYDADGTPSGEVDLPDAFAEPVRPDLIRKAVDVARANRKQAYGSDPMAGKRHPTESKGVGQGQSRVPRLTRSQRGALAPSTVGGRRAHPPTPDKDLSKSMNTKERKKAIRAAVAATADPERVRERGHRVPDDATVPVVVEDDLLEVDRTRDLIAFFENAGFAEELARADKKKVRAGKGKGRGRRYRTPVSALIVVHEDGAVRRAAGNLPGVEVASADELGAEALAPGGDPGRLLVVTRSALEGMA